MAKAKKGKMPPQLAAYWAKHRKKSGKSEEKGESKRKEAAERRSGGEKKESRKAKGRMTAAKRKKLPKSDFGLPGAKGAKAGKGKYPMPNRSYAIDAKSRAKQMLDKGKLSKAEYSKIVAKANRKLGKKKAS